MGRKLTSGLASMALMMGLMDMRMMEKGYSGSNDGSLGHGIPDKPKKVIPNGCKEYSFYGFDVVAISEKSARKKAKKLLEARKAVSND